SPALFFDTEDRIRDGHVTGVQTYAIPISISGASDVAGKVGRARHFAGSGDRVTAPAISVPAADFTVAAWFRWTTNPSPFYSGIRSEERRVGKEWRSRW